MFVDNVDARGDEAPIVLRGNSFGGSVATSNVAEDDGGAVDVSSFRDVIVEGNTFADNVAGSDGGGLEIDSPANLR